MEQCSRCGEYLFTAFGGDTTPCKCQQFTIIDENGEEADCVYALSKRDAAIKYAERSNIDDDYYLMNETVDILVNEELFRIGAEPSINYSATPID